MTIFLGVKDTEGNLIFSEPVAPNAGEYEAVEQALLALIKRTDGSCVLESLVGALRNVHNARRDAGCL